MFAKLKNEFVIEQYKVHDLNISFGIGEGDAFKGIRYNTVTSPIALKLYEVIPTEFRHMFGISLMTINTTIPPHTDSGIKCTINFYIKTQDCVTQFYKFKDNNPGRIQIANQTDGYIFKPEDVTATESFVAQPNEAWILDVSKPHGVTPMHDLASERIAISLATRTFSYEQVYDMLVGTGQINRSVAESGLLQQS